MTDTTETARLHDEILGLRAELATVRDLLRSENQRGNAAITREETAEEAALEAHEQVRRLSLMVDEYGAGASALTDKLRRVRELHRETCVVAQGVIVPPVAVCGLCEVLDAPASVVVPAADRAAVLEEAAAAVAADTGFHIRYGAAIDYAEHYAALLRRLAVESAVVDRVAAETPPASGRCPHGCDVSICPCLACEADRLDVEEAQQPERCANCGKPVQLITGTLSTWWVHDPGGHTVCHPQQAATSTRATPGPAVEAQPGKDTETRKADHG